MKYADLTHKIIGCAMEVHNVLGNGFQEVIYQRCLAVELDIQDISFAREVEIPIYYKGRHVGTRRVDFLIDGIISTELKAVISLDDAHLSQGLNYLEAFNLETGLLINFGSKRLQ
jgi:GxxExxY protein